MNAEKSSVGQADAWGGGKRGGRGRGREVTLAEYPDPSPARKNAKSLSNTERTRLHQWLTKWGISGN